MSISDFQYFQQLNSVSVSGSFKRPKAHVRHDVHRARWQQCQGQQGSRFRQPGYTNNHQQGLQASVQRQSFSGDNQFGSRRQSIIGQARDTGIRAVPAPDVELTVTQIDINSSQQDLGAYINSKGVLYKDLQALQEGPVYSTFYVKVTHVDMDKVLNSSFWPEGILVRNFYPSCH